MKPGNTSNKLEDEECGQEKPENVNAVLKSIFCSALVKHHDGCIGMVEKRPLVIGNAIQESRNLISYTEDDKLAQEDTELT